MKEAEKKYIKVCNAIYTLLNLELVGQDEADVLLHELSNDNQELKEDVALVITKTKKPTYNKK